MFVYFIQALTGGPIKIGYSSTPNERLKSIQTCNPEKLQIIGLLRGSISKERELHKHFANCHLRDEWFNASVELINFVANLPKIGQDEYKREIQPRFVDKQEQIVFELYKQGYSLARIGSLFNFSRQRAHQIATQNGKKLYGFIRGKPDKPIEQAFDELIALYNPLRVA